MKDLYQESNKEHKDFVYSYFLTCSSEELISKFGISVVMISCRTLVSINDAKSRNKNCLIINILK
jgi:hypothetical protein